jgi:hypothetical protein
VDVAWNPAWKGTHPRTVKFDGDRLDVVSAWTPNPSFNGRVTRNLLVWEREKKNLSSQ